MNPARKAVIWTAGWLLLLPLLLQEGAQALECYSCVQKADDGCSPQKMKAVKCAPDADVCTEAVGAVETIHGQPAVAVRGCGSGLPGKNDRGLDLHGLLAFIQLQQCSQDLCNTKLNLTSGALNPAGNESAYKPNGIECYSCMGLSPEACQGSAPPVVNCYNASDHFYKGCFDGKVTLTAASVTVSLPIRGCVTDELCTRDTVTGPGFTLSGSCCQGSRCNSDLRNKTYFAPRIPPLVLMTASQPTTPALTTSVTTSTPAPPTTSSTTKPSPAPASQTPPEEKKAEPEASQENGPTLAGGAAGHQDRSNVGKRPVKGELQDHSKGSSAPMVGLATLLLAVVAGALL
ncbi:ly6/PLAUR domain-containing protein 3 [Trichechus manatus latirostris]|uniref:Ly6/PLAUR domain-containing protein 3 n=1 Tax=Trichechus manatus latirostris TaxID=127582 RepID=A0A2Y9E8C7_TRIMA|nr:ly6/PLAUR domain-containing protein 3 [Trichechus manatus latirostris]